jgi:hypothetical protein
VPVIVHARQSRASCSSADQGGGKWRASGWLQLLVRGLRATKF